MILIVYWRCPIFRQWIVFVVILTTRPNRGVTYHKLAQENLVPYLEQVRFKHSKKMHRNVYFINQNVNTVVIVFSALSTLVCE